MKRFKFLTPVMLLAAMLMLVTACDSFEEYSYKTLKSAATAYDAAMTVAGDYYGDITDADEQAEFWEKVEAVAEPVQASLVTAKNAAMAYSRAKAAYDTAEAAAGDEPSDEESSELAELQTTLTAAKAAAKAAIAALDVDAMSDAISTIIDLFTED